MRRYLGIAIAAAIVVAGLAVSRTLRTTRPVAAARPTPRPTTSNITARDYVGPKVCAECHPDEHARWSASLHRVMNQRVDPHAVVGAFDGRVVHYAGGEARFQRDADGTPTMTVGAVHYRITRTIGVRGLQEYVGIEAGHTDEVRLPFAWWPRRGGWYPQPFFDPWLEEASFDAYAPVRDPWAERCPWCHSTYPFALRIARAAAPQHLGHGLERFYTGSDVPSPRAAQHDGVASAQHGTVGSGNDVPSPERAAQHGAVDAPSSAVASADAGASTPGPDRLAVEQQVTVGISCESCHLGGREHAAGAAIQFLPIGAVVASADAPKSMTFAAQRRDAAVVNRVCAQCHSGPSPRLADGTALRNSSEALDLAASPCTGIRCTDCHDPHRADARAADTEQHAVAACTHCHTTFATAAIARSHAGHDHVNCLDCHMPRIVMGIDRVVRTHRISSPTNPAVLAEAGPNACNLCHLDRTIAWTTAALRDGWDVHLDPTPWAAYGDRDVGEAWLAHPRPAFRLLAAAAYARVQGRRALPALLGLLDDELAYMRCWTLFAIEDVIGRRITDAEYDPRAPADERAKQLAALRRML